MTCIVAVKDHANGRVVMACDSQASNGGAVVSLGACKVVTRDGFLFGSDGPAWLTNFYRYGALPSWPQECCPTLEAWCVMHLAQYLCAEATLRNRWKDGDFGGKNWGGQTLVARGDSFVLMGSDGGVLTPKQGWWAIGSGGSEARGAIFGMGRTADDSGPELSADFAALSAVRAVRAAIALDDGCGGPVIVKTTGANNGK